MAMQWRGCVGMAGHHCSCLHQPQVELKHSSTGWAMLALKELKSSKYLFLVVRGCTNSLLETMQDGGNKNVPLHPALNQLCFIYD